MPIDPIPAEQIEVKQPKVPECDLWGIAWYASNGAWRAQIYSTEQAAREYLVSRLEGRTWHLFRLRDTRREEKPAEDAVERAAEAARDYANGGPAGEPKWGEINETGRNYWRKLARAVLASAALRGLDDDEQTMRTEIAHLKSRAEAAEKRVEELEPSDECKAAESRLAVALAALKRIAQSIGDLNAADDARKAIAEIEKPREV
jgi:hypothetical protein